MAHRGDHHQMRRWALFLLLSWMGGGGVAAADEKLVQLIPNLYGPSGLTVDSEAVLPNGQTHSAHFNGAFQAFQAGISQFNAALVTQLVSVPLPSPSSAYTYRFDPDAGVFVRSTQSFGPILADRADTLGRDRLGVAFTFQQFTFDSIDGLDMNRLDAVYTHDNPAPGGRDDVLTAVNDVELKAQRFTAFLTDGVGSRVDVSLAVPLLRTELSVVSDVTIQRIGTSANPKVHFFRDASGGYGNFKRFSDSGDATGIGDLVLRVKAIPLRWDVTGLATGVEVRLPTGDEENLLGSGALGLRPFVVLSSVHRISPHLNLAYQWNGESLLAGNVTTRQKETLPHQILATVGADMRLGSRVTLAADLLGRRTIDATRLEDVTFTALDKKSTFPNIAFGRGSYNILDGAVGLKWNPIEKVLVHANVMFKLNENGIRDSVAPLLAAEYSF
jgi:hypothetical protein